MQKKNIEDILAAAKVSFDHPLFYPRIFALVAKNCRAERSIANHPFADVVAEEYEELSRWFDRSEIQESCSVRNVLRTRAIARMLIDEKGEVNLSLIPPLQTILREHLYSLGPKRHYDAVRQEHILKVLEQLQMRKELVQLIKKFSRPLSNKWAEELIKQTLQLPRGTAVTDAHTRQAVLSAWLCYLRQNVGSCFATAPAEIVHDEQPEQFLLDLLDLISTGRLTRTYGGVENSVPCSASWGSGDLKKPLFMHQKANSILPELWFSPGLIAAFEAVGFFKSEAKMKEKMQQLEGWMKPLILRQGDFHHSILTAEQIIRSILLKMMGLTEKQIKEYENRPQDLIQTQLVIQTPQFNKSGEGLSDRCAQFFHSFEEAKNVFKSFADNALLKAWEFTLASFSDIKYELARWNFYASLGLENNQLEGIGQCIYEIIQSKLDEANRKVQEIQPEYEMVYTQVKTLESRMRSASTEKEAQWLRMEYQTHANEFYFLQEQRDLAQERAASLVNLYETLYKLYVDLFKDYFQEIYDADMQEVTTNPFDDSPAGFRLVYKHGRSNTSQWTHIKNQHEFIDALASFFVATEPRISHALMEKNIEKDLADVVTKIINHIKTKPFLENAFHRMAIAHRVPPIQNPLDNLDKIEKKPWVYTSGGTMNTLVSCYYRIDEKPKESEKWVENEMELLVFLTDVLKNISPQSIDVYLKGKRQAMLMQSPTHAFLLKPMEPLFREMWTSDEFTYTFIRDRFVKPSEMFVERLLLNDEMLKFLIQQIMEKIPENFQPRFRALCKELHGPINPIFFRDYLVNILDNDRGLRDGSRRLISQEEIDGFLYSALPLCPIVEIRDRAGRILSDIPALPSANVDSILRLFDQAPFPKGGHSFVTAQDLQSICKAFICLSMMRTTSSIDYHLLVCQAAQRLGFAMPAPLIFADTNWVKDLFAFAVNPGTGKLGLWRMDYMGSAGYPMTSWKQWLNGSRQDLTWGVYIRPFQYGQN